MYYLMYQGRKKRRGRVWIDREHCTDCEQCLRICKQEVFILEDTIVAVKNENNCNGCRKCIETCVYDAIEIFVEDSRE